MKKYMSALLLMVCIKSQLKAQQGIIDSNTVLLNNLEARYKSPCIKYEERKIKRKKVRIDKQVIQDLNTIYYSQLHFKELVHLLENMGYKESSKIKKEEKLIDTTEYKKVTEGQLNAYIELVYNNKEDKLYTKKIILATKRHFFCETREWQSYSYIDFDYLRRFVNKIKIPLRIAWSNVELESM